MSWARAINTKEQPEQNLPEQENQPDQANQPETRADSPVVFPPVAPSPQEPILTTDRQPVEGMPAQPGPQRPQQAAVSNPQRSNTGPPRGYPPWVMDPLHQWMLQDMRDLDGGSGI